MELLKCDKWCVCEVCKKIEEEECKVVFKEVRKVVKKVGVLVEMFVLF